jgi:hypothetical protein
MTDFRAVASALFIEFTSEAVDDMPIDSHYQLMRRALTVPDEESQLELRPARISGPAPGKEAKPPPKRTQRPTLKKSSPPSAAS